MKKQYWYQTEFHSCVLCGSTHTYRYRVYKKPDGIIYEDFACNTHFI